MEMVYRGFPVEQARQQFEAMKQEPVKEPEQAVVKVRRKLRKAPDNNK